jgi:conjugal transfer mating pair stabilization protein TraG
MEGRRDYAGVNVAGVERANVATEQGWRSGSNQGQREARRCSVFQSMKPRVV